MKFYKNIGDNHMKRARQINFDTQGGVYVRVPSDLKKKQLQTDENRRTKQNQIS